MRNRTQRRSLERQARKAARKAGLPFPQQQQQPVIPAEKESPVVTPIAPPIVNLTPRQIANRANALLSTGAKTPETKAISALNHTIHGLARHAKGTFKLLTSEDPNGFEALKRSLIAEHAPSTETERILVNGMAESHWLAQRAQRIQDHFIDPHTGIITDEKQFSLYVRYQTTHTRAFHKNLADLLKLRAEKRKTEIGFEAQRIKNEQHEMKKQLHEAKQKANPGSQKTPFLRPDQPTPPGPLVHEPESEPAA